jgi:steroid 5-alpha reductase family enzyme
MKAAKGYPLILLAYVLAAAAAVATGIWLRGQPPIVVVGLADLAATIGVFVLSAFADNSSVCDPYWSVAPVPIALFWLWQPGGDRFGNGRHDLIVGLLCLWAIRLTANWASRWQGLGHEDWRYQEIRGKTRALYWPVSFLGIHLMPTILVFLGCLALWPALTNRSAQLSLLDGIAVLVTLGAILIEATADRQMQRFRRTRTSSGQTMPPGLWLVSRHPNYFGEVSFWWGIFLFGLASGPANWWTIAGPLAITLLFLGISIPLMERHLKARYPSYADYQRQVSRFFPRGRGAPTRSSAEVSET